MRINQLTIDFVAFAICIAAVLLIIGVLPFTAATIGVLLLLTQCEAKLTWRRS